MPDDKSQSPLEALNARGLAAKREYVRGLEQRRDAEALSLLVECLCDESWFLRDLAEQAFFRMGEEHAGPLLPLLEGGLWYTRLSATRLLGRLGYRPAVPALIELGDDQNETVSQAAREALLAVARLRGMGRIAHALQRATPDRRQRRLAEIAAHDRGLAKQLERLMADVELMAADQPDALVDPESGAREVAAGAKPGAKPGATLRPMAPKSPPLKPMVAKPPEPKPAAPAVPATAPKPAPEASAARPEVATKKTESAKADAESPAAMPPRPESSAADSPAAPPARAESRPVAKPAAPAKPATPKPAATPRPPAARTPAAKPASTSASAPESAAEKGTVPAAPAPAPATPAPETKAAQPADAHTPASASTPAPPPAGEPPAGG